jgi:hypothetical protein
MKRWQIIAWSAFGGLVQGLIAGVIVLATVVVGGVLLGLEDSGVRRWMRVVVTVLLVGPPLVGAVLGALEGRRKLR